MNGRSILTRSAGGGAAGRARTRDAGNRSTDRVAQGAGAHRQPDLGQLGRGLGCGAEDVPAGRARLRAGGPAGVVRGAGGLGGLAQPRSGARAVGGAVAARVARRRRGRWRWRRGRALSAGSLRRGPRPAGSRSRCAALGGLPSPARGAWRCGDADGDAAARRARQRGVRSLTAGHDGVLQRWPSLTRSTTRVLGKSEQQLKPPLPSRVYIQLVEACAPRRANRSRCDRPRCRRRPCQPHPARRARQPDPEFVDFKKYSV